MDGWHSQWLSAIRAMTSTTEEAAGFLDRRLRFTTAVAQSLSHYDPRLDSLVYGVWLEGHEAPVYIGQTTEGRRRLWDLPIGESHHLANSFPPEIWSRVVVVYWGQLLEARSELSAVVKASAQPLAGVGASDPRVVIGLGLEYLLQRRLQPLFNRRKKRRDGGWREVAWDTAGSVGARAAPHLNEFFDVIFGVWEMLAAVVPSDRMVELPDGRVAFPAKMATLEARRPRRLISLCRGPRPRAAFTPISPLIGPWLGL